MRVAEEVNADDLVLMPLSVDEAPWLALRIGCVALHFGVQFSCLSETDCAGEVQFPTS
jgi:hypothetical protein